jgi:hypothetical protein
MTFAVGGDLGSVVLFQEAAWAALVLALAATAQRVTRSAYSLGPIILLAMHPGLLNFRNIIAPETFFTVFLNLAVLGLLLTIALVDSHLRPAPLLGGVLIHNTCQ